MRSPAQLRERAVRPRTSRTGSRVAPNAALVSVCLLLLLCSGVAGFGVAGESAIPFDPSGRRPSGAPAVEAEGGAAAVGGPEDTGAAADADLFLRLHTAGLASRPGLRFVKGVLVVKLDEGLQARLYNQQLTVQKPPVEYTVSGVGRFAGPLQSARMLLLL